LAGTATAGPDVDRGKALFEGTCAECHDDSSRAERLQGPPLFGVVGRKVGSVSGFGYSESLKKAGSGGKIWTESELDAFLADPDKAMPGGYMPLAVTEEAERLDLIAYLKTLVAKKP
jgi:cytochrome c2